MAQISLPIRDMANIMGIPHATFERMIADSVELSEAIEKGRSNAKGKIYETLYSKIVEDRCTTSLLFWLKTKEGFREVDRLELTGKDGAPIKQSHEMTPEQREAKIEYYIGLREKLKRQSGS